MKKLLMIVLIVLATCTITFALDSSGLFLGGIFNGGFNLAGLLHLKTDKSLTGLSSKDDKTIEKHFKVPMGKTLNMNLSVGGTIKITGWDKDELYAKVYKGGRDADKCKVDFEENSDGIKILSEYVGERKNRISTDFTFEIKVPKKFDINLDTMGGGISIENVEGNMTGETKGGQISLNQLKGNLKLRTMGGRIDLTDSEVDGSVSTMGGDVVINNVKGDVKGSSMGGNVTYNDVTRKNGSKEADKEVNISSMGGEINVDNAPNGANVTTMGGDIKVGSVRQFIKAKTMGGDIQINEADGSVNATTMSGDVNVKVLGNANSTGHDVKLTSMSGDITLYVPADFSMDVDITIAVPEGRSDDHKVISDFDLKMEEKEFNDSEWHSGSLDTKRLEAKGSFNGGKNRIQIVNMNGNVYLKKI